jgi:hypothetical protein
VLIFSTLLDFGVLYICIPAYDEASTVGLLLWRIRKVFQEFSREYEIAVYDDGSSDATAEILAPYRDVLPLTVLGGAPHRGYGVAVDALCQWAAQRTRYARRDAAILLQGDFTDQPEHLPELVKRFEGGADIVVAETPLAALPTPLRRARRAARWALRPFATVPGVSDPFSSLRLYRISVLRDARKRLGETPLVTATGWLANAELLLKTAPAARRIEVVEFAPRYDLRTRASRVRPLAEAMAVLRFGPAARGLAAAAGRTAATKVARATDVGPDAAVASNGSEPGPGRSNGRGPGSGSGAGSGRSSRPRSGRRSSSNGPESGSDSGGPDSGGPDLGGPNSGGPDSSGPDSSGPDSGGGSVPRRGRRPTPSPDRGPDAAPGTDRARRGRGRGRGRARPRPVPVEPAAAQTSEPEKR